MTRKVRNKVAQKLETDYGWQVASGVWVLLLAKESNLKPSEI